MAKLKSFRRIITTDYDQKYSDLVEKMGSVINDSVTDILFTLNGRLDIRSNFYCTYKEIEVTVDATGTPTSRTVFTLTNPGVQVIGLSLLYAANQDNPSVYPTTAPFISWVQVDNGILINNITGLQANNRYKLRIIAWN
jgi:hypothetical protein